ncbi:telomerase protein component 1 isoform X2 [Nerophis ophidion]|uniref:telomerase protein component 1 isoform X2 n=1 Tax=Nerophis ophidion TaxID=159077 RepID=UPI002AE05746|nr:telomerase protein component 1 isoform X2 [Nerophis ophidion]
MSVGMKPLNLQTSMAPREPRFSTSGTSLTSNYVPPSLENKLLSQTSLLSFTPQTSSCISLLPSSLTSTSSNLLLSSPLSLPFISTQNKLLDSSHVAQANHLLATSMPQSALLSRFSQPHFFVPLGEGVQRTDDDAGDETSEAEQSSAEETSMHYSDEDDQMFEEESEEDASLAMEADIPELDHKGNQGEKPVVRNEEFAEVVQTKPQIEEEIQNIKYRLLNAVCCSLVNKCDPPGQKDWDSQESLWTTIINMVKNISVSDPQFVLKVALYARQELNIRITANFLLALAANQPTSKCHVRRYFCAIIQLPSDWLEVIRIYKTCFSRSLPMCLKKAMADKFKEFSEYQLAKYNTRKHRCKHNRNRHKRTKPTEKELKTWANLLRSDTSALEKYLKLDKKIVVDKKQSEFNMKKMIKLFHIKEPAQHVMAVLGRKYPSDLKTFNRSGLTGAWEHERAGQRMKLKEAETWERLLSLEGNNATTWEKLIDNKSLPFMAMLRNLRNMISKGISQTHHQKVLSRLNNKKAVLQSRQFPFRFLSAYKVIMELREMASPKHFITKKNEILKEILKKFPKSKRFRRLDWETANRKRLKATLGVPFVYHLYRMKKDQLLKANQKQYTVDLLDRYREALEEAMQISCRYNIPPLPGRTVILLNTNMNDNYSWSRKLDFCLPPNLNKDNNEEEQDQENDEDDEEQYEEDDEEQYEEDEEQDEEDDEEQDEEDEEQDEEDEEQDKEEKDEGERKKKTKANEDKLSPSMMEVAALLALMTASSCEDVHILLLDWNHCHHVQLTSDVLLENVRSVMQQIKTLRDETDKRPEISHYFPTFLKKNKVDTIISLTESWSNSEVEWAISNHRKETSNNVLFIEITMLGRDNECLTSNRNHVKLAGFSEQMLRFVSERGSSRLLDHVEHLDKVYDIPPPQGAKDPEPTCSVMSLPTTPKLKWRDVRVFISSTFRDMHAERDILVRSVFPELRRRAAAHRLHLQEVELRWGVTEEETGRAIELCLAEVCRSQMLVGILGERYGVVLPRPVLPDLPQYRWLAEAPNGLSVTEMELRQFQAINSETAKKQMFCYFRDPNATKSVPVAWKSHFSPESKEAESKLASLKQWLQDAEVKVTKNYQCEWGGVVEGKPYLKNLEDFAKAVLEDLWAALVKQFVEEDEEVDVASEVFEQEVHQGALERQFLSRTKLLSAAVEMVEQVTVKGGLMVVEGRPGQGKTVFMAALAKSLKTGATSKKNITCDVLSYSTAASPSHCSEDNFLRCLVRWLRTPKEEDSTLPLSYKDLVLEFHATLKDMKRSKPLVLLVDGVDQLSSDWIPQHLPHGVCLVLSATSKSALLQVVAKKTSTLLFSLTPLTMTERREITQRGLEAFGKKLSDSAFNNQLQTLIMKKGAESPLYLYMACEDLRNFSSFDKLKESLQDLPQSLNQLIQYSLERLCSHYRDVRGLRWALAALTVSAMGLRERDFYLLLSTCNDLCSLKEECTWQEVLRLCKMPKGRIPMATFTRIVQSLRSLMSPSNCRNTDDLLSSSNLLVKKAFKDFLLPTEDDTRRAHLVLAGHLWVLADAQGTDTFLHCEVDAIQHLSASLIQSGKQEALRSLLSSYYFLYAHVRHNLLHHLMDIYNMLGDLPDALKDCQDFLQRHATVLASWPTLFIQQALNEPSNTPAHAWAQDLMGSGTVRAVEWLNNHLFKESSQLMSTFMSKPTCLAMSSDGEMVVGTGQGTLHFINTNTGQQVKSLVSSCDGISTCVVLKDRRVATTSFDGQIEIWDSESGFRTALKGHTNVITASDITSDEKHLATASLDLTLKVWSSTKGHEVAALPSSSPLNCVTFDPEDRLLAAGRWDGKVVVWHWLQDTTQTLLSGHRHSVRSLSFTPSYGMLCSGSVSGEVRVWSVDPFCCVGCFQAHAGTVDALTFLDEGRFLLTAGSDYKLQLWSGGLGRSVAVLKKDQCEQEPPHKKVKCATSSVPGALCAAVKGDYVAVGYHNDGFKLFCISSGERIWVNNLVHLSVPSLLWLDPELLLSTGYDKRLRLWKKTFGKDGELTGMEMTGMFAPQMDIVRAVAQSSTYLATASDDCTVFLWLLSELTDNPESDIKPAAILKGHSKGVTCLAFSPDGGRLLSGGKDKGLVVSDITSDPPVVSKVLPAFHRDWITGCVWTPDCVISSSADCRLCLWDVETGRHLQVITWKSPFTSVCCQGPYVAAGCADGNLHVWKWETCVEVCHIPAHNGRIHSCSVVTNTDKNKEVDAEDLTILTTSQDGTANFWKPLQMEHINTFQGHSGAVCSIVREENTPHFLTVSEDCSLRSWTWETEHQPSLRGTVSALCFSQSDHMLLVGYESGLLELWQDVHVVGHKQASDCSVTAICSMPNGCFAVGYIGSCVDVWKVVWNQKHSAGSLVKMSSYTVSQQVVRLGYCSVIMAVSSTGLLFDVTCGEDSEWEKTIHSWNQRVGVLGIIQNDDKSMWLVGEDNGEINIGFIFAMGPENNISSSFSNMTLKNNKEAEKEKEGLITAVTMENEFVVCGDVRGNMWFNQPPEVSSWSSRKPAHHDKISVLRLMDDIIISASMDRTVKLWDRSTKKQVGMFVCGGPVLMMEVNPGKPSELVCCDGLGKLYFLSWRQ